MSDGNWINRVPLFWIFFLALVLTLLSMWAGYAVGSYARRKNESESEPPIGSVVGAMLGLLAFMLAISFGIALGRFETRKKLLLDEVNAIGTTLLRTDYLPGP
jgi:uncharacterized protein YneF (UPF0154 family)